MKHPLLIGGPAGLLLAALAWPVMLDSLAQLDQIRTAASEDAARVEPTDTMAGAGFRLRSGSVQAAQRAVAMRLRQMGKANGVLIERIAAGEALGPTLSLLTVELSGSEKAVLSVAAAMESEGPGVRWRQWRLSAVSGGVVRLSGEVAIAWR